MAETKRRKVGSDEAEACDVESGEYGMWDEVILSEEEMKKKLVYIITTTYEPPFDLKLKMFNPHDASTPGLIDKTYLFQKNLPTGFGEIRYQAIAALESKLYFIGGVHTIPDTMSNKVFAFDTASEAWDTATAIADTKQPRFCSTVLTFQNKIYVFGSESESDDYSMDPLSPEHWAEFYDPKTNKWDYLPVTPPEVLMLRYCSTVHVLMEELKIVLFCVDDMDFYGYSFEQGSWFHAPPPSTQDLPIYLGDTWGPNIAVVNSSWFLHSGGIIYRYDLKSDTKAAAPICTIKQSLQSGLRATPVCAIQQAALPGRFSQSFFFVYAGNGKLCLVHSSGTFTVCQTFGLHSSRFPKQSSLRYENFVTCGADEHMYAVCVIEESKISHVDKGKSENKNELSKEKKRY